ncbi:Receptor-like protein kinase [Melia azedarach]|uniref:Receptor-like protein kinase n=1 Tax=Melia azedarach TaxID=155640 RepID=A0ACC1XBK7_MELAZ|nr:Receptor-like protein kinase [Melia azedarach]
MLKTTPTCLRNLLMYTLLLFFLSHANSQIYDQEHAILLKLKQHWQNPPLISHWTTSKSSHCTWPEIVCTDNSVTNISLINISINETIPPFICDLKNLTKLDLSLNYIPGQFPNVLYNCSKLEYLDLSQNYFVGSIPDDIDSLSRLQFLSLGANNFSGDIPASVGRLTELRTLGLFQCLFNGSFPSEIGNLQNLEFLGLAFNRKFVPSGLPSNFTQLKKLKTLWMTEANLIGEIPETIGNMAALEILDLSENSLTGKIPSGVFRLKNLSKLYLYKNGLSGEIPQVIESLNLTVIDLSQNNLTGKIPNDFGKFEKLLNLSLMFNQLSGEIPVGIGSIPTLKDVRLFNNNLSGALPPDFGRYSPLEGFQVATNNLTGGLPEYLCASGKLVGIIAFDNHLSGELPESLGNCSSLQIVSIYKNEFTGKIPGGLWTASNLSILQISSNKFTGELPDKLGWNLSRLEISNNRFSGKIPTGASSWRNLAVFQASNNLFTGTIPRELTALPSLLNLLLDQNQLSGSLPSDIISWKSLTTLYLRRNQLSGEIPEEIGSLPGLTDLDLSENQFSGQIPSEIGQLTLFSLNLSSNHLTGEIPIAFENGAFASSFLNNPGLCARSSYVNLKSCRFVPRKSSKISSTNLALISSVVIAVFLVALLSSFFIIRVYNKRKRVLSSTEVTSFHRLNFTDSDILPKLTESNVIGSGGSGKVFRVPINRSCDVVAVKKIWNSRKLDQKHEKEFLAEVQILSTIRHLNIVKLLCCISNENLKLLVYEYLENRSLDRWLHKRHQTSTLSGRIVLDWPRRMRIAVGAAQGLCYMHHDCSPPIVHRDMKSSNILLDSDFNAKIADFGLARILIKHGELATMSTVAGSFGYIAPEYAQTTKVNEKSDIYSFGVILLELTTGREANCGDEHTCLAKWSWRHFQEGNPIVDALDEDIKEPCYLEEMSRVFKLGIMCTSTPPTARPSMKTVLQILLNPTLISKEKKGESKCDVIPLLENSKRERMSERDDAHLASLV